MRILCSVLSLLIAAMAYAQEPVLPGPIDKGYLLPNGWRITPTGKAIETNDLLLNIIPAPDGKSMVALHGGFNPHGLVVVDTASQEAVQRIPLPTAWYGMAWSPDGSRLYVSGGNRTKGKAAPIYVFDYSEGRLTEKPVDELVLPDAEAPQVYWSGVVHHPEKPLLYAANRTGHVVHVFNTDTGALVTSIPVEQNPYALVVGEDARYLYCSNWGSDSVSVIDLASNSIAGVIAVGDNPSDMALGAEDALYVCCANDNQVVVIDTEEGRATGAVVTSLHPNAPEGSTPNALTLDPSGNTLYVANGDNNDVCVIDVGEEEGPTVLGFIPAGWYPSAVAVSPDGKYLHIGNGKGLGSYSDIRGPSSPLPPGEEGNGTVKSLQRGAISIVDIAETQPKLRALTQQAIANSPYHDALLSRAPKPEVPSVIPSSVGAGSAIKHVIYIIKENRTYDQVFGDLPQGNGDPRLCIFGREITPNLHALAEQFVLLDNLYCDAEVSVDGHQWSNAAYATDYIEKYWPAQYSNLSKAPPSQAMLPGSGYIWDQCARKGMTYRSYGEFAERVSRNADDFPQAEAVSGSEKRNAFVMAPAESKLSNLHGHIAPNYLCWDARDTENAKEFIREFEAYEAAYDNPDPEKRLPQFIVMALPEDHTRGTRPGAPTPRAAVASNDYGLGMIVDRVSHSKYWPETAIFVIEDDGQAGPDHVDARRTIGFVISPYVRRGTVDSTLYTTSSMLRSIELLLGLPPMSQYDAAANPMYAALGDTPDLTPYTHLQPNIELEERNEATAWGAGESQQMDLSIYDRAPMFALNEIVWKSIKGPDSEMPLPIVRFVSGG